MMTDEKIQEAIDRIEGLVVQRLEFIGYDKERIKTPLRFDPTVSVDYSSHYGSNEDAAAEHVLWMTREMSKMHRAGIACSEPRDSFAAREKVMRWLGFAQGVLWFAGLATIDELRKMNMPDVEVPE